MRIEVKANLILTIPEPTKGETAEEIILAAEQCINNLEVFSIPSNEYEVKLADSLKELMQAHRKNVKDAGLSKGTLVGIRIHVQDERKIDQDGN